MRCAILTMMGWTTHVKSVGGPASSTASRLTIAMLVLNTTQKIHCAATIGFAFLRSGDNQWLRKQFSLHLIRPRAFCDRDPSWRAASSRVQQLILL